ncbi:matrin-3-like [Mugil cephalus]|uniref:matrin-3-like n=1 Tax=Mugil cephalus TaxID=48193 RepID=UPI001FB59409|nr:matrin-3-like [Mugil cephalus]
METSEGGEEAATMTNTTTVQQETSGDTPAEAVTALKSDEPMSESEHASAPSLEASGRSADPTPGPQTGSQTQSTAHQPEAAEANAEPDVALTDPSDRSSEVEPPPVLPPAASADSSSLSPAAGGVSADTREDGLLNNVNNEKEKEEKEKEEEEATDKQEQQEKTQNQENAEVKEVPVEPEKPEKSEDNSSNTGDETVKTECKEEAPTRKDPSLPPFDPSNPVGMEFLVPKTGFFCKVCSRFFSGAKEAEISHCKTLKHYGNLQKYLETTKASSAKSDCS